VENKPAIYGLVLIGGFSKRMGKDKALLSFHDKPQFAYLFDLLQPFCEKVFLSCRKDQSAQFGDTYPLIFDLHDGIGPMNGLLSFFEKHPTKACLLVACDMPFIDKKAIQFLIKNRQSEIIATAFKSKKGLPEPLLTIWEPNAYSILNESFQNGNYSLRDILQQSDCQVLQTIDDQTLLNINKPEELEAILKTLNLPPEKS
jgi:molybdopterin-guanine dinucleotide biosynthesis protein A